jgi:hypothetical protein
MRATMCLFAGAALAVLCCGCSTLGAHDPRLLAWKAPVVPPGGLIYTHYKAPLTGDVNKVPVGGKTGIAKTTYVAYPFSRILSVAWADASIKEAARNGGLTRVEYADYEGLWVLGVYAEFTVTAHGE